MSDRETKVLGYVAIRSGTSLALCDGDACIVAGSEKKMNEYIRTLSRNPNGKYLISKARYGHVLMAMKLGGIYSFDEESYARFLPLAVQDEMEIADFGPDAPPKPDGPAVALVRVEWKPRR